MSLSILIPTHNRPALFRRCLMSVLDNAPNDVEIIVNNDSNDIIEIESERVRYFYHSFGNLSAVYRFLLQTSTQDYVYFLEDDDYLRPTFFRTVLPLLGKYDIISGNYFPMHDLEDDKVTISHKNGEYNKRSEFLRALIFEHLQLSKFVFRRSVVKEYPFPEDSNVQNDAFFLLHAVAQSSKFICIPSVLYYLTVDGRDNISFSDFNPNMETSEDFYEKYRQLWR